MSVTDDGMGASQQKLGSNLATIVLLLASVWACSPENRSPFGEAFPCTPTGTRTEFVVGTFNIQAGVGVDGNRDLGRVADALAGSDFVGFQEVDNMRPRSGFENQTREIAGILGHSYWEHFPAEEYWPMGSYGNAASASLPVIDSGMFALSVVEGKAVRKLAWIKFLIDCRPINVFVIHVTNTDNEENRAVQIEEALDLMNQTIGTTDEPIIFMGDFNSPSTDTTIQKLQEHFTDSVLRQSLPKNVKLGVDYIFIKGELEIVNVLSKDTGASDHLVILVTLR